jgi:hypothetical protein
MTTDASRAPRTISALTLLALAAVVNRVDAAGVYDPRQTFAPLTLSESVNRYRSGSGAPGPDYWQNRADYEIHATLDPVAKTLVASLTLTYTNHSPDTLESLWLQLDQNLYREGSRGSFASGGRLKEFTDGYSIDSVELVESGRSVPLTPFISDTRMQVPLPTPLRHSASLKLRIRYHYVIPGLFGGRTGWIDTKNGAIFDIAQWYPRMAVYDDVRGWDTAPYIGQEFYLEYGDFDYSVTAPADMLVAGTGELVNATEVLTPLEQRRLEQARSSDQTVAIRSAAEIPVGSPSSAAHTARTWHYRMRNTRDVAFSASRSFLWDAARIRLPAGRAALAMSFYPLESAGTEAWGRSTEYLKDAVERFSQHWYPYPYPTAVNIAGGVSGMEYPGMAFNGMSDRGKALFWITAHEIGHSWFPMTVGTDERRDAWMDEGFNTFIDTYESDEFAGGVYGPKRDSEYAPGGGNPVEEIETVLADPAAPPIVSRADTIPEKYRHTVTYFKTALGLRLLREQILGPMRFDRAFRKFIRDWAFRHPKPADFFRTMESEGGEDLAWFWRGWFLNNWQLDLAVDAVDYPDDDPAKGARVTLSNLDRMVMPSVLEVKYANGDSLRLELPVETWMLRGQTALRLPGRGPIVSVTVDPDHLIPDKDRSNNVLVLKTH